MGRSSALIVVRDRGTLRDRIGPVVTFREYTDVLASYNVEVGELPSDCDPTWAKDNT